MIKSNIFKVAISTAALCLINFNANADVTIEGTRIVYPENTKEKTIKFFNEGDKPALMQLWVDNGDVNSKPNDADTPFIIMPPVFRVDAKQGQNTRISLLEDNLPKDRESIFWFNALEIPQKSKDIKENEGYLQIATRSRLKLFYRPSALKGNPTIAAENVNWTLKKDASQLTLTGENNSPFFTTFASIKVTIDSKSYDFDTLMINPFSNKSISIKNKTINNLHNAKITYQIVDNYGFSKIKSSQLHFN